MASNLDRYKNDLEKLMAMGLRLLMGLLEENKDELSREVLEQQRQCRKVGNPSRSEGTMRRGIRNRSK
jgi:hypothetical protein